jgi:hypothetical protein
MVAANNNGRRSWMRNRPTIQAMRRWETARSPFAASKLATHGLLAMQQEFGQRKCGRDFAVVQ